MPKRKGEGERLDQALLALGHYTTRSKAADAVRRGCVQVNGVVASKPGFTVSDNDTITIEDDAQAYVSRGALKLAHALSTFGVGVKGTHALDVGASTGGFTQVLLEKGAEKVIALDVGHDQLAEPVVSDPRVIAMEGVNARNLAQDAIPYQPDFIVIDVSFISLHLILPPVLACATADAVVIALIKPQFEVGAENLDKSGVVRDQTLAEKTAQDFATWVQTDLQWELLGVIPSPIAGGSGNKEFLLGAQRKPA